MRRLRLLAASGAALAITGCGGGNLSLTQLQQQATRVCGTAAAAVNRIPTPASPAGTSAFLEQGVGVLRPELRRLRGLKPPSNDAQVYDTAIAAFSHKLGLVTGTIRGLQRGTDPVIAVKALQRRLSPTESAEDSAWHALEIPACLNR